MKPIDLISASAGTGKTWTLCQRLLNAIQDGANADQVMAVTFTRAAAAELAARSRQRLLADKLPSQAQRLQMARIGTVHGVFGALLGEHSLAAGRSPVTTVISESAGQSLFRIAADVAIRQHADKLDPIGRRFGHHRPRVQADWRDHVQEIVKVARENGISDIELEKSAEQSWETIKEFLDPVVDGKDLDRRLIVALRATQHVGQDGTKATTDALAEAERSLRELEQGRLAWADWVGLASLKAAKASDGRFADMRAIAAQVLAHAKLHEDIEAYIHGVFKCAADSLKAYADYKRPRGLMDFADQEAEALNLLNDPQIAERLGEDIALFMVDEFQDTSPLQLALFLRVSEFAKRSLWVGDAKQAIYGFRGTDPELISAAANVLPGVSGGKKLASLSEMRRSRPPLVAFFNDVFTGAFEGIGIQKDDVVVQPIRPDFADAPSALQVWRLQGTNVDDDYASIAAGVASMLAQPYDWPVLDRSAEPPLNQTRPLRGGDIVVLLRSNEACAKIAEQLSAQGLKVALSRPGLLARAECVAALASLKWLSDPTDTLALAELAHIMEAQSGGEGDTPGWLSSVLNGGPDQLAESEDAQALERVRGSLVRLTPAEALDAAIAAIDLPQRLRRFGDATARLAALDALRALARAYQDEMLAARLPATPTGLVAWLEDRDVEEPASPDPEAVHVLTMHKSKGLEWPVVILGQLDQSKDARLFDQPQAKAVDRKFNPTQPLANRQIRFWPWPFAKREKVAMIDRAKASVIGQEAVSERIREEVRLLYVAMTRARDYLVFAAREKTAKGHTTLLTSGLNSLGAGRPDLSIAHNREIVANANKHSCGEREFRPTQNAVPPNERVTVAAFSEAPVYEALPYILNPSGLPPGGPVEPKVTNLEGRLPLTGECDMAHLGEALHGFLAADDPKRDVSARMGMASGTLHRWSVSALTARDLIAASDRLWTWLSLTWPGATLHREWPVTALLGEQRLLGRIDLIVAHDAGYAIVDHKAFPGGEAQWAARSGRYRPQLNAYAEALQQATGKPVTGLYLHLPVPGVVLSLEG